MSTGWNDVTAVVVSEEIINLLGNEYWLERYMSLMRMAVYYKPTGK